MFFKSLINIESKIWQKSIRWHQHFRSLNMDLGGEGRVVRKNPPEEAGSTLWPYSIVARREIILLLLLRASLVLLW